jgi:hypothetical protein
VNQNKPAADGISYFNGMDELHSALVGCDTVFNVHEYQDFSNTPDKKMLEKHNVECKFFHLLINLKSKYFGCSRFVACLRHGESVEFGACEFDLFAMLELVAKCWKPRIGSKALYSRQSVSSLLQQQAHSREIN